MPQKKKKNGKKSLHFLPVFLGILVSLGLLVSVYSKLNREVQAVPSYTLRVLTPSDQIRNGGTLEFGIDLAQYRSGERLRIGAKFDSRKLRLDTVADGAVGDVTWTVEGDGDEKRIILSAPTLNRDYDTPVRFAVLRFTIDDQSGETNADGRGFTEICTLFTPDETQATPTTSEGQPTAEPSTATAAPTEPPETFPSPTPIDASDLDRDKLCIPLEVNGSPADKMDWVFYPINYESNDFDTFFEESHLAVSRLAGTNLSGYRREVLDKQNWYIFNPSHSSVPEQYRNRKITNENMNEFLQAVQPLCPHDRFVILVGNVEYLNDNGNIIGGQAAFYIGMIYPAKGLYMEEGNGFAHEWGHAAAALMDEYDAGQWISGGDATTGFNCTREPSDAGPVGDPCPYGRCTSQADEARYQKACPKWDCALKECTELERRLFEGAGCFPRCSSQQGYRPNKISVMDGLVFGAGPDVHKFNGVSLYSIIRYTFGNYR
ncbi:hypothetical protein IPM65_03815 [Candidatus Roizmanbacteria bacterium]|nr:MAG: hypothetical protein IPM65_03815 [Candidatus Roizmanbacteria bacterium]